MLATLALAASLALADAPFGIRVVDEETGRGVPLVELSTTNQLRYVTDSAGYVAFDEPGLFGQKVFFSLKSHGYEFAKDGFGFAGKALDVTPGGEAVLKIRRKNIAERLYRVIGGGIYADSVKLGKPAPIREPLLNAQVFGSDSVVNVRRGDDYWWFWGDTNRPRYPLGQFHVPGATSKLPGKGGLDPDKGVDLVYWKDGEGFARKTAELPGEGPTWIGGAVVLPATETQPETLVAGYVKVKNFLDVYEHGLAAWDEKESRFKGVAKYPEKAPNYPTGHAEIRKVEGADYVVFDTPFPHSRVKPELTAMKDLAGYEGFTCLEPGTGIEAAKVERDSAGRAVWGWKKLTPPLTPDDEDKLIKKGRLREEDARVRIRDEETGRLVKAHGGNVAWNAFRKRWSMIFVEAGGESSFLGEVWYAESDAMTGPWLYARKVVTHDKYSFYNPKQHPVFEKDNGRLVYFEGTYCTTFSGNDNPTPRYDYNQVMYRLDLSDPRMNLPVAFYREGDRLKTRAVGGRAEFYAKERPGPGLVGIVEDPEAGHLRIAGASDRPIFYALQAEGAAVKTTRPLPDGRAGSAEPIARVWSAR